MKINSILNLYFHTKAPLELKIGFLPEKIVKLIMNPDNIKRNKSYFLNGNYLFRNRYGIFCVSLSVGLTHLIASITEEVSLERYFRNSDGIILDIGSHIGKWAVFTANHGHNLKKLYAFEPIPSYYRYLETNKALNDYRNVVSTHNLLISDSNATLQMADKGASSHVSREGDVLVESVRMDDFLMAEGVAYSDVDLVKIDVEGHELSVLCGMSHTLKNMREYSKVIIECLTNQRFKEAENLLSNLGFNYEAKLSHTDFLFIKSTDL